jgi:hypothetical protein
MGGVYPCNYGHYILALHNICYNRVVDKFEYDITFFVFQHFPEISKCKQKICFLGQDISD